MKTDPWLHTLGKVLHVANGHLHAAGRADNLAREVFLELRRQGYPRAQKPWLTAEQRRDFLAPLRAGGKQ